MKTLKLFILLIPVLVLFQSCGEKHPIQLGNNYPKMSIRISRDMPSKFLMDTIRKYQEQFVDI